MTDSVIIIVLLVGIVPLTLVIQKYFNRHDQESSESKEDSDAGST